MCNERLTDVGTCILQHPASSSAGAATPAVVQTVVARKENRSQIHDSMFVVNKLFFAGDQLHEVVHPVTLLIPVYTEELSGRSCHLRRW